MRKKNDTFAQMIVGLFMVTILLLLGYFTIVISGVDIVMGRERARLRVAFEQIGGLKEHDGVMYRGAKVGTVERIEVTPTNLIVTASVDGSIVLREGCSATVCSLSMLGGNCLQIEEGRGEPVDFRTRVLQGDTPSDWLADMSRIARNLRTLTERLEIGGIITNLESASRSAMLIARRIEDSGIITNLETTSRSVSAIASRVERGEGLIGRLTSGNDGFYDDIRLTVGNIRDASALLGRKQLYDGLEAAIGEVSNACAKISAASDGVNLKESLAKANAVLDNLNAVTERLKKGEGTLGRLTSDETLYKEVDGLIRDCRQIIDNYRDTTPISTFTSLATGAL